MRREGIGQAKAGGQFGAEHAGTLKPDRHVMPARNAAHGLAAVVLQIIGQFRDVALEIPFGGQAAQRPYA